MPPSSPRCFSARLKAARNSRSVHDGDDLLGMMPWFGLYLADFGAQVLR
jgi:hypothetical protein